MSIGISGRAGARFAAAVLLCAGMFVAARPLAAEEGEEGEKDEKPYIGIGDNFYEINPGLEKPKPKPPEEVNPKPEDPGEEPVEPEDPLKPLPLPDRPPAARPAAPSTPLPGTASPKRKEAYEDASEAVDNGDYDSAWDIVQGIIRDDPEDPSGYQLGAWVLAKKGRPDQALEIAKLGLNYNPNDRSLMGMAAYLRGEIPRMNREISGRPPAGSYDSGRKKASGPGIRARAGSTRPRILSSLPEAPAPVRLPAVAGAEPLTTPLIQAGLSHLRMGDESAAIVSFTAQIEKDPNNWVAFRLRSIAKRRVEDFAGSFADASRALELAPDDAETRKDRGRTLIKMKRHEEAIRDLDRVLRMNPNDAEALVGRALAWKGAGDRERQLADLRKAAALDASFADLYRSELAGGGGSGDKAARRGFPSWALYAAGLLAGVSLIGYALLRRPGATTVSRAEPERAELPAARAQGVVGFDVVRKLGQGGMGEVWEATDRALQRRVAIKKMRPEIAGDPRERKRFLKEARLVAALRHPNIIEIFQVLEEGDELYLVFEFVDGKSLAEVLDQRRRLSLPETLGVLRPAAAALDYAHSRSVIHQDLKPANIMVAGGTVKVMDFGIARRVAETMSTMSRAEIAGTPVYMSPEQEQGLYSPASDVFALGACFYQMLAGHPPFNGADSARMKRERSYAPLSSLVPGLPSGIDGVVARALEPEAARRFQSAGAFAEALSSVPGAV